MKLMPNEKQARELHAIIEDVKEHLAFLNELGVARIDDQLLLKATKAVSVQTPAIDAPPNNFAPLASPGRRESTAIERDSSVSYMTTTQEVNATGSESTTHLLKDMTHSKSTAAVEVRSSSESLFDAIESVVGSELHGSTETLEHVWNETRDCTRCPLWEGRTHVVNSEGNPRAQLMFVGEAPGADEDAQARPFVGRAGQLLNKIIESIGLKREDVFIGNVNRCRPPQNRTPTLAEGITCKPFIIREIDIVQPKVIVVLGNVAMKNLLDTKEGITKLRGKFQDYRGIKVMPTFHPAYLLRDPSKKRETWEDMKTVRDYLNASETAP